MRRAAASLFLLVAAAAACSRGAGVPGAARVSIEACAGDVPLDHAELRARSYQAALRGAREFAYACSSARGAARLSLPESRQAVDRIAREMEVLAPILGGGAPAAYPPAAGVPGLETGIWRRNGREYLVLLDARRDAGLRVPEELLDRRWRPLFQPRRDARDLALPYRGSFYLAPRQVLVLESGIRRRSPL